MSRLCRLRNASHGDDGQWAYSEIVGLREQLAALAEQNERMRVALQAMVDEAFARNCGLKIADDALSLPDLASPVLNETKGNK